MSAMREAVVEEADVSAHEQAVLATLGAVRRRRGFAEMEAQTRSSLASFLAVESRAGGGEPDSVEEFYRVQTFRRLLAYVFEEGPDPAQAMRRLYALAKSYTPELLFNMSDHEIGMIFGETRAAVSWRRDKLVTKKLKAAGAKSTHVRCQKTESARRKFSKAQRGNRNRANGARKAAVLKFAEQSNLS